MISRKYANQRLPMFLNYNMEILTSQKQDSENFLLELNRVTGLKKSKKYVNMYFVYNTPR